MRSAFDKTLKLSVKNRIYNEAFDTSRLANIKVTGANYRRVHLKFARNSEQESSF